MRTAKAQHQQPSLAGALHPSEESRTRRLSAPPASGLVRSHDTQHVSKAQFRTLMREGHNWRVKEATGSYSAEPLEHREEKYLACGACNVMLRFDKVAQHCAGSKHREAAAAHREDKLRQAALVPMLEAQYAGMQGERLPIADKKHRYEVAKWIFTTLQSIGDANRSAPFLSSLSRRNTGDMKTLMETNVCIIDDELKRFLLNELELAYPELRGGRRPRRR